MLLLVVGIVAPAFVWFCGSSGDVASPVARAQCLETETVGQATAHLYVPSDPYYDEQWAVAALNLPQAWLATQGSEEVLIAVLDTGIDGDHEDLLGRVVADINFSDSRTAGDVYGHGTHIAGIVAAATDNGVGISGAAPGCALMNVKVADDEGKCDAAALADSIMWAVDRGAKVLNMSLRFSEPSRELEEAVNYAWEHGAVVVAAAGHGTGSAPQYPAYYDRCIAVTAVKEDGTRVPLANYGDWVDVAAPGYQIYSTLPDDEYGSKSGTSQAVAYVSGVAGLLYSIAVDSDGDGRVNDEVRAAIEGGCRQLQAVGMGTGLVDAAKAVELLNSR